jgi:4-amino-4-deoxy-L-arabinose transferase-like glycosyltransferase
VTPRGLRLSVGFATAFGALLRVGGLASQPATPAEHNAVPAALGYLEGFAPGPVMPTHPHLRDLGLALGEAVFGPGVVAARGLSVLLGTLCIPLIAALVWRLSSSARAALIAAVLVAIDPLSIFFSRLAYMDVWTAFFALLGAWLVAEALLGTARLWCFPLAGLAFGLGAAAKFNVLPIWAVCGLLAFALAVRARRWPETVWIFGALAVLPLAVYVATWAPWFGRGHSAGEWLNGQAALLESMAVHAGPKDGVYRFAHPSLWFVQPFAGWGEPVLSARGVGFAFTVGHPLTWLLVLPAVGWALLKNRRRRAEVVVLLLFFAAWGAMLAPARQIWLLSAIHLVPFALALVALAAADLEARFSAQRTVRAWLVLAAVATLLLFPGLTGRGAEAPWLRPLVAHLTQSAQGP